MFASSYSPPQDSLSQHIRFGLVYADHLDADKIAYATQAREMQMKISLTHLHIHLKDITFFKSENLTCSIDGIEQCIDGFPVGFTSSDCQQLYHHYPELLHMEEDEYVCISSSVSIGFVLCCDSFDYLHHSINSLELDVLKRLMPQSSAFFTTVNNKNKLLKQKIHYPQAKCFRLDTSQMNALSVILNYDSTKAPIVIFGSFGTGKTHILATAIYNIFLPKQSPSKVLLCANHTSTIDTIVFKYYDYFKLLNITMACITDDLPKLFTGYYSPEDYSSVINCHLILATFSKVLNLQQHLCKGHFTHVLIDEGAQVCEPDAIASLCLATCNTKVIIVGDHKQVSTLCAAY